MAGPGCPRITLRRNRVVDPGFVGAQIGAYVGKRQVGAIFARIETDGAPYVSWVEVEDSHCRQGIATRLYEAMALDVCREFGKPLHSDTERSGGSQAFWEKQVQKGRAECVEPAEKPGSDAKDPKKIVTGRGGCLLYRLKDCSIRTLTGRRR